MYPLSACGAIYSPKVIAVRDLPDSNFVDHTQEKIALITAQNLLRDDLLLREDHLCQDLLREKLRTVLWIATTHGHDTVILGAFGAGAFGNPVTTVIRVFQDLLASPEQPIQIRRLRRPKTIRPSQF